MTDIMGEADEYDENDSVSEPKEAWHRDPMTLALLAFPLAFLVTTGTSVFRGIAYTVAFASAGSNLLTDDQGGQSSSYVIAAGFITAAFSLIPLLVAVRGLHQVIDEDPTWVKALLRASIALASLSLALHLIIAVIGATSHDSGLGIVSIVG